MKDLGVLGLLSWPLDWDLSSILLHAHSQTYMPTCIHTYIRACMCMYIYTHMYIHIYIYIYLYIYKCVHTYTHIHIHVYLCKHIYIHTHIWFIMHVSSAHGQPLKSAKAPNAEEELSGRSPGMFVFPCIYC